MLLINIFLLAIIALGLPIFIGILAFAMLGFYTSEIDLSVISIELYRLAETPLLIALPLFTFAGYCLSASNTAKRFVNISNAIVGDNKVILPVVILIISAVFTAFTGASGVTIVALGAILLPALKLSGYPDKFSLGIVTISGSLGLLLPPSIPLILYGVVLQQMETVETFAITDIFLAGILPCLLMIMALGFWCYWTNRKVELKKQQQQIKLSRALYDAIWELPLPILVIIGIYGGYFVISEVAALTAFYVLAVEFLIYREISAKKLLKISLEAIVASGGILIILGAAMTLSNYMIDQEVPSNIFNWMQAHVQSKWVFLILLNIFLLILGAFLDIFSSILLIVPLVLPTAIGFGINPIHLGIIFLTNMQIGYMTPPVGMNLFISCYRFNKSIIEVTKSVIPFLLVLLGVLLIITYVPAISLIWF